MLASLNGISKNMKGEKTLTKIDIPKNVKLIIKVLEDNGYEAYAVGGCVRDAILGRKPNDWDITTSAMPEDVKQLFHKTIDTGIVHGTVTVMIERTGYEVTTYRIDGKYEDGRHPKNVEFTGNLVEDLKRRDFTINAMAYNDRNGIVDEFNGIGDLYGRVIKCVGNPEDRFNEDALRILRAVRFAAALDFDIEEGTREAIVKLSDNLNKISKERIQAELEKLIMSNHPEKLRIAYATGITKVIFKEIDRLAETGELESMLYKLSGMPREHYLRWAMVLCQTNREESKNILRELKFDNKTINTVSKIVEASKRKLPDNRSEIRRGIYEIGEEIYPQYLEFMKAFNEKNKSEIQKIQEEYEDIIERGECVSLKGLSVNGRDLLELGADRGAGVGEGLQMLLYKVLDNQKLNEREILINIFKDTFT